MDDVKKVLVAVDLTEMDETLVSYTSMLSKGGKLEKVYFLNVQKHLEIPEDIIKKYPDLVSQKNEETKLDIQKTIDKSAAQGINAEYEILLTEGNRSEKILQVAKSKNVDLIIMGRKSRSDGEGIVATRVVKFASCTVIFVPKKFHKKLRNIIVPIDYSEASKVAFEFALYLAKVLPAINIKCLNIYEVPSGFSVSGKSYEEFAEIMRNNSIKSFEKFISKFDIEDINVQGIFELHDDRNMARTIMNIALREKADGIAVGSRGRNKTAAILLGSIAQKLIKINTKIPLVVVREKKHSMSFIEAFLHLYR